MKPYEKYEKLEITNKTFRDILRLHPERANELDVEMVLNVYQHRPDYIEYHLLNEEVQKDFRVCTVAVVHAMPDVLHEDVRMNKKTMLDLYRAHKGQWDGLHILERLCGIEGEDNFAILTLDEAIKLHKEISVDKKGDFERDMNVLHHSYIQHDEFAYATIVHDGSNISSCDIPDWMKADKQLALIALDSNQSKKRILHNFDPSVIMDMEVALVAVSINPEEHISYIHQDDPAFIETALEAYAERYMHKWTFKGQSQEDFEKTKDDWVSSAFTYMASQRLKALIGDVENPMTALSLMRMKKELEADLDDTKKPAKKQKL